MADAKLKLADEIERIHNNRKRPDFNEWEFSRGEIDLIVSALRAPAAPIEIAGQRIRGADYPRNISELEPDGTRRESNAVDSEGSGRGEVRGRDQVFASGTERSERAVRAEEQERDEVKPNAAPTEPGATPQASVVDVPTPATSEPGEAGLAPGRDPAVPESPTPSDLVKRLLEDIETCANVLDFMGGDDNESCAAELRQRGKEAADRIEQLEGERDKATIMLQNACDRDWKDETFWQTVNIAANAIYWRGQRAEKAERELAESEGVEGRCAIGHNKKFTYELGGETGCVACEREKAERERNEWKDRAKSSEHNFGVIHDELAESQKDAERYRWLCDGNGYFMEEEGLCGYGNDKADADAAIDAATKKEG